MYRAAVTYNSTSERMIANIYTHSVFGSLFRVNITAFGLKLTLFSAIPLFRFSLNISRFFAYFKLGKNALCMRRSAQPRQVELGNPL